MKKKLIYLGAFLITAALFNSCDLLSETCQDCAINVYNAQGVFQYSIDDGEYCGDELIKFKAIPDYSIGDLTARAECE
jgi:hypothetical protein